MAADDDDDEVLLYYMYIARSSQHIPLQRAKVRGQELAAKVKRHLLLINNTNDGWEFIWIV